MNLKIFSNTDFLLSLRWDNQNFSNTLPQLFDIYITSIEKQSVGSKLSLGVQVGTREIWRVTEILLSTVDKYLNRFPAKAFETLKRLMQLLEKTPLKTHYKSIYWHRQKML